MDATTVASSDGGWQHSRLLPLFSFLPRLSTPLHIQKLGTGSLMADFTQEILQRSVENIDAAIRCVRGWMNGSPVYRQQSH